MIFRNLDSSGDWEFGNGLGSFTSEDTAIGLNIATRIKSWVNDCFFDLPAGIDWINRLGSKNQRNLLEVDLRRIILQSYGVVSIIDFETIVNDRNFSASYNIQTIYSPSFQNTIEIGF